MTTVSPNLIIAVILSLAATACPAIAQTPQPTNDHLFCGAGYITNVVSNGGESIAFSLDSTGFKNKTLLPENEFRRYGPGAELFIVSYLPGPSQALAFETTRQIVTSAYLSRLPVHVESTYASCVSPPSLLLIRVCSDPNSCDYQ